MQFFLHSINHFSRQPQWEYRFRQKTILIIELDDQIKSLFNQTYDKKNSTNIMEFYTLIIFSFISIGHKLNRQLNLYYKLYNMWYFKNKSDTHIHYITCWYRDVFSHFISVMAIFFQFDFLLSIFQIIQYSNQLILHDIESRYKNLLWP